MFTRAVAIIILGFIAYGAMLPAPFRVMDDRISIVENPVIKSTSNALAIFKEGYFHDQSYYRPLVNLSYMGEYHAFGYNSFFYNLDNLILHTINALLVVLLVSRLTGNDSIGFWTGLLFVMHPVQWEAVCNIPGRSILLSAFFALSSFILVLEYYKKKGIIYLWCLFPVFFAGLLCKESAGVLPLVVAAFLLQDNTSGLLDKLKCLWPFIVVVSAYILLRRHYGITYVPQTGQWMVYLLGFVTFLRSVITDLRLFIFPFDLHFDRCLPFFTSFKQPQMLATCSFWASLLTILLICRKKLNPFIIFLMGWFCLELLPVSQLVTSIGVGEGRISTAEHFLYLASIPVFIGLVMAFGWVYTLNSTKNFIKPSYLKFLAGGFLAFLLLTAVEQSIYASNEYTMVTRSLTFEPMNPRLQGALAMLSVFRNDIPDAQKHFELAIKAEPLNPTYHIGLGTAFCQQGRWIQGLEQFVAFDPPAKDRSLVERQERLVIKEINRWVEQGKPIDARGWLAIGIYYAKIGENKKAIDAFQACLRQNPRQADAWFNLGSLWEAGNDWPAARKAYQQLLALPQISAFQKDFAQHHLILMRSR